MTPASHGIMDHLRRMALMQNGAGLADSQLLEQYVCHGETAALAALVRRHRAMVWGVCIRLLQNHHDAEDAFQATFVVLIRRAASIVTPELLANWLYGVANQTARKARATSAKRRVRERLVERLPETASEEKDVWRELRSVLDLELSRLPARYRAALILCDLEGRTRHEAACQLGLSIGTLSAQVHRGRKLLTERLARHGVTVSGGALALILSRNAVSSAAPITNVSSLIKAASLCGASHGVLTGLISARLGAQFAGGLTTVWFTRVILGILSLGLLSVLSSGFGWSIHSNGDFAEAAGERRHDSLPRTQAPFKNGSQTSKTALAQQTDEHARILFAHSPHGPGPNTKLAGIRTTEKKESFYFDPSDHEGGFRVSPNGKRVAYYVYDSITPKGWYAVHVRDFEKPGPPEDLELEGQHFCWSPDGTALIVSSAASGTTLLDLKTKKRSQIGLPEGCRIQDWFPGGQWLLVLDTKEGKGLCKVKADGTNLEPLPGTEEALFGGRISPDGKSVLFDRFDRKTFVSNLYVLNLATGKSSPLTEARNGHIKGFSWSPSGSSVAFIWARFDPDSEKSPQFDQEVEAFLTVCDADGQHSSILLSRTMIGLSAVDFTFWDWR